MRMFRHKVGRVSVIVFILTAGITGAVSAQSKPAKPNDNHDMSMHCQHVPADCEDSKVNLSVSGNADADALKEPGESIFGTLSEINQTLEQKEYDWSKIDMDALWEHLRDMNALMTQTTVVKTKLKNGLRMTVKSSTPDGKRAVNNMIPAHSAFLSGVRKLWKINYSKEAGGYTITVTSDTPSEIIKIQALGFSGFMIQDDHHRFHHFGLATGENRMSKFIVTGAQTLSGNIEASGNKNEALPVLAAAMLSDTPLRLFNIPQINDIAAMISILRSFGTQAEQKDKNTYTIHNGQLTESAVDLDLFTSIRGSFLMVVPLLHRFKKVTLPTPGGDSIGRRRLDTHLLALSKLGVSISFRQGSYIFELGHAGNRQIYFWMRQV
ncbi:hypothetical protein CHS0354_035372 [Potamilus streckersoni]|uniref:UDP-N-acetylglucosamine 1-carboxyvinyltransferase n=1 Tax=Potamilus streckersoni TaxID=2493646 RepID=A0AAE0S2V1_9BIVA|nr:hypothetical protein CHS0354_035372 [Potamilus streckersoni]